MNEKYHFKSHLHSTPLTISLAGSADADGDKHDMVVFDPLMIRTVNLERHRTIHLVTCWGHQKIPKLQVLMQMRQS